jgi:hypothetical protein
LEGARTKAADAIVKRYHECPATELFNLRVDPFELNILAAAPAQTARLKEMRGYLETWMKEQGDRKPCSGNRACFPILFPPVLEGTARQIPRRWRRIDRQARNSLP